MHERLMHDRYRLIERLALGGTAEVWRAHDEKLDRPVAVKRLHPHLLPDEASRRRLAAEARAVAALSHPVVVGVYDVDIEGEAPVLVMELVEGESLAARIGRDGPLPPRDAAAITADLADALFHAHQQGVIHRDIKPGNVLLATDGRTRLVDFGIAHSLAESAEHLTHTGTVIGTLRSMAPEQLEAGPITPRTDLYGLGVVLHEALTGRPPYPSTTALVLADAQRSGPPPLQGIDPALAALISTCLAYDPSQRPLHAGELAAALREWLGGDTTTAVGMASGAGIAEASDRPSSARSRRGRPAGWPLQASAATLGALLLLVLLNGTWRAGDASAETPTDAASPTPMLLPAWVAELVAEVAEKCGADVTAGLEANLASMGEEAAQDHAEALIDTCEAADEEGGQGDGQGREEGNGGNGGNGNGGNSGGGNGGNGGGNSGGGNGGSSGRGNGNGN